MTLRGRRKKLLVEAPASATSDIAFTLIVFFLVAASVQPDEGRPQDIPNTEDTPDKAEQNQNLEVSVTESTVVVNSEIISLETLESKLKQLLAGKKEEADRVVILKSSDDVTYQRWMDVTGLIQKAGGVVTLQLEQQQTVIVD
tara:strand:- start:6324 stop:6752 length:429 start_codon:yes stop_codon:yes gene_type:complete